ncbi:MAG: DUF3718 domain-containing protein [Alteromonadaceae bacterium]|nr:DUF3718 domain-containing protein [Alteromonadaceae bacterium]
MKTTLMIAIASLVASSFILVPTAEARDPIEKRICEYISVNDKTRLRSFLKQKRLKIRHIYKEIKCNNDNLLIFAAKSKALDTGEFIIGKLTKKMVASNLKEIVKYSAHLAEDAKDRIE